MPQRNGPERSASQQSDTSNFFVSLTVENVRCFGPEPQTLQLSDETNQPFRWTVVLGNNNSGKTTLLQCLAMFDEVEAGSPPDWIRLPYDAIHPIFGRVENLGKWNVTVDINVFEFLGQKPQKNRSIRRTVEGSDFPPYSTSQFTERKDVNFFATVNCYGYGSSRRMGKYSLADTRNPDRSITLFDESAPLLNVEEWLMQLDYAAAKRSNIQKRQKRDLQNVIDVLIKILPDVEDIRFPIPSKRRPIPSVEFRTPDGWIPLRGIGHGYRTFMAWIVDFASRMMERYPDSEDPLAEKAVVLVDEIDLHLHPKWQRQVIDFLTERFPNTQFIVTAHSPIFVHAASEANIVVLRRDAEKGHVVIDNDPEIIRNWRIDQLLTSDLFGVSSARPPQVEPLIQERKQILSKKKLTGRDKIRLEELETAIGPLPTAETVQEIQNTQLLDRTLELLQKKLGESP